MRGFSAVLALIVLLQVSEAAVLLRFINTVPTRTPVTSRRVSQGAAAYASSREASDTVINFKVDRVGLLYTVTDGSTQSATTVWTELRDETDLGTGKASPYAWIFGMPPLRAYHGPTSASITESSLVDRVANYLPNSADNQNIHPSCDDLMVQSQLKADGVGLYLSFAPGRYNIGAYGVRGAADATGQTEAQNNAGQRFTSADRVLDFTDGQVYTLIAVGNGNFGANNGAGSFGDSATVKLVLLQESTAATTFGMASLRFFHAIQAVSDSTINIQDSTTQNTIVNALSFGSASDYMDVVPKSRRDYAVVKTSAPNTPLAPTDALALGASLDVRAGLRATVICANTDMQNPTVFCRMIPSRVVAYVRLVNDNAANFNFAIGSGPSQRMADVTLSLWASYYMPYPSQVQEQSQYVETRCARADSPALFNRGLYPVVQNIAANGVSDYGEVHVPVFIMDYAVRSVIREIDCRAAPTTAAYTTNTDNPQDPANAANQRWFELSPIFKRVHFIVKTSGLSTLTGRSDVNAQPKKLPSGTDNRKTLLDALLINEYMEPGQYYTLASSAVTEVTNAGFASLQLPRHTSYKWRLEEDVASVSAGVSANVGTVRFIALPGQDLSAQALSISGRTATFGGFTNAFLTAASTTTGKTAWNSVAAGEEISLAPGSYTWSAPQTATPCTNSIPSGTFTIQSGKQLEIFVLGSYSCSQQSTSLQLVQKVPALATQPSSQCNPSSPPSAFLIGAAGSIAPSAAVFVAAFLAALLALVF